MPSKLRKSNGKFVSASTVVEKTVQAEAATIPTSAGATDKYVEAPVTGKLTAAQITSLSALAAHDTNFVAFTITNLGQDGLGSTAMLASSPAGVNTTKITGGIAQVANAKRALTVHATAGNVAVTKGDRLKITATGNGTLANTVTVPVYLLSFEPTS